MRRGQSEVCHQWKIISKSNKRGTQVSAGSFKQWRVKDFDLTAVVAVLFLQSGAISRVFTSLNNWCIKKEWK